MVHTKIIEILAEECLRHLKIALVCTDRKLKDDHTEISKALSFAAESLRKMEGAA